jgi:hypothetical protein
VKWWLLGCWAAGSSGLVLGLAPSLPVRRFSGDGGSRGDSTENGRIVKLRQIASNCVKLHSKRDLKSFGDDQGDQMRL